MTARIRPAAPGDVGALYEICLKTGDHGADATPLYRNPKLIGAIYAAPYAVLEPSFAFVAEDASGVCGYVVGASETRAFEARLETDWWPQWRRAGPAPTGDPALWSPDERRLDRIHRPRMAPEAVVAAHPAHLHMNILRRARGAGLGRSLFETWREAARAAGATSAHVAVSERNAGGAAFWRAMGFADIGAGGRDAFPGAIWLGRALLPVAPKPL